MATTASTKPVLPALKTPLSATYPSELQSPLVGTPTLMKREECEKTPITPPTAYIDFLKAFSPVLMSPLATSTSSRFSFGDRPASTTSTTSSHTSVSSATATTPTSAPSTATITATKEPESTTAVEKSVEKPANSEASPNVSRASSYSSYDSQKDQKEQKPEEEKEKEKDKDVATTKSTTPPTAPPHSPFVRPLSARTPRRLHIPQSPYSPASVRSPMSAHSVQSPYSAATNMSPRDWDWEKSKPPGSATSRGVSVRQVVTRTVTYTRTPIEATPPAQLDPAPKGKRRKIA